VIEYGVGNLGDVGGGEEPLALISGSADQRVSRESPIDSLPKEYSLREHRKREKITSRGVTSVSPSLALCRTPRDPLVS
jgi:hypothetical protein